MARKQTKTDVRPLNSCNETKVWTGRHNERLACVQVEQTSSEGMGVWGGVGGAAWAGATDGASKSKQQLSMGRGLGALTPEPPGAGPPSLGKYSEEALGTHGCRLAASQVRILLVPGCLYFLPLSLPHPPAPQHHSLPDKHHPSAATTFNSTLAKSMKCFALRILSTTCTQLPTPHKLHILRIMSTMHCHFFIYFFMSRPELVFLSFYLLTQISVGRMNIL